MSFLRRVRKYHRNWYLARRDTINLRRRQNLPGRNRWHSPYRNLRGLRRLKAQGYHRIPGIILSASAGIISTGPIYAWYPLLKDLREKGAGESSIAIFLYNRAVKPFLLPVMVGYFGWLYVVILTIIMVIASVIVGFSVSIFTSSSRE